MGYIKRNYKKPHKPQGTDSRWGGLAPHHLLVPLGADRENSRQAALLRGGAATQLNHDLRFFFQIAKL